MLNIKKNITLTGETVIDGVQAAGYQAIINSTNPADMNLSNWQNDKEAYKANRTQCLQEYAQFLDTAYALQDKLIAEKAAEENAAEEPTE